ncbi:hypothetical protein ASU31_00340 [Pedobacter ginsenosidimutans]|uniref:Thioredoxin domain-containing protein n=1 Tax=Pedobacter ginsenosidimutans TaxID=687842 RepID=A0A0T5VV97_9SPHI|nr:hypothetical protein [Pedobacter ginsenosidimutans]KRT17782.1 hypothetical protein ASU31_00340 [Pedobacter ginsenosidimutans]
MSLKSFLIAIVIMLAISTSWYAYKTYSFTKLSGNYKILTNDQKMAINLGKSQLPSTVRLNPVNGSSLKPNLAEELRKNPYTLLVIFEPTSCGSCLGEFTLYNSLKSDRDTPVIGISSMKDQKELETYIRNAKLNIPVYQDSLAFVGAFLQPAAVPAKVLVDSEGKIKWVDYVRENQEDQNIFAGFLSWYVQR